MTSALNVVFAGTPDFSVPALAALHAWCAQNNHQLVGVLTQPDRPAGRGRKLRKSPVKDWAEAHHVAVDQPPTLRQVEHQQTLQSWQPDIMVVVAYGLLLPIEVLELPRYGCINVHASILPRWRGAAPIQRAILAGDETSGVAIMQMDEGLDTGPVWSMTTVPIDHNDTGGTLHDKLAQAGAQALTDAFSVILDPAATPTVQDEKGANYAKKLTKQEAAIDWQAPALDIQRAIRAFNPWPVAHTSLQQRGLRVFAADVVQAQRSSALPGTVISVEGGFFVATGNGVLNLLDVQPAGGRRMDAQAFLNAHACLNERFQ